MKSVPQGRRKRGFQKRVQPTAKTPKDRKYSGLLTQLTFHTLATSGRFIAALGGGFRDTVHSGQTMQVMTYIPKHACSQKNSWDEVYEPYTVSKPAKAICFLGSRVVVKITWFTLRWVSPCKLEPPCRSKLWLCLLLTEILQMASASTLYF